MENKLNIENEEAGEKVETTDAIQLLTETEMQWVGGAGVGTTGSG